MNSTTIDWCDMTWNPLVGCQNSCYACYANRLHTRRHLAYKNGCKLPAQYALPFNEIQYFPNRLQDPQLSSKTHKRIFVVSMGDLFAPWVNCRWRDDILLAIDRHHQHTFILLTKFPQFYPDALPENTWIGTSICMESKASQDRIYALCSRDHRKFLSLEPITGDCSHLDLPQELDFVITGGLNGSRTTPPPREWIASIPHPRIFYKRPLPELYGEFKNQFTPFIKQNQFSL